MAALSKSPLAIVTFGTRKVLANFQEQFSHHRMFSKKDFKNYEKLQNSIKQNSKVCVLQCNFFSSVSNVADGCYTIRSTFSQTAPRLGYIRKGRICLSSTFPTFCLRWVSPRILCTISRLTWLFEWVFVKGLLMWLSKNQLAEREELWQCSWCWPWRRRLKKADVLFFQITGVAEEAYDGRGSSR